MQEQNPYRLQLLLLSIDLGALHNNSNLQSISISKDATFDLSIFPEGVNIITKAENKSPTDLSTSTSSFDENITADSVVANPSGTDSDSGDTHTYSLVSGDGDTDNSAFTIDGNKLSINASPDYETKDSYCVLVQTQDSGGLTFEKSFTFSVNDVEESPISDDDSDGFVDGSPNYQLFHSGTAIDLTNSKGTKYSEASTPSWDAIKAIKTNSGFQVLLDGAVSKQNKFYVWTTNDSGVITKGLGWETGDQMMELGIEDIFGLNMNVNPGIGI